MTDVPQSLRFVLDALTKSPSAWVTPAEVAIRLGRDVEETTDALASLDEAGLIVVREPEGSGPIVAPSPRGADLVRRRFLPRSQAPRDPRPASTGWVSSYDRPNHSLIAATAAGSVAS